MASSTLGFLNYWRRELAVHLLGCVMIPNPGTMSNIKGNGRPHFSFAVKGDIIALLTHFCG